MQDIHYGLIMIAAFILFIGIQGACLFVGYAVLFSHAPVRDFYFKMRRGFDLVFAFFFGAAGIKIFMSKLSDLTN
ncbi:MAG: hypothetical protein ACSHXJ_11425 [Marinomonas colpomeniae]